MPKIVFNGLAVLLGLLLAGMACAETVWIDVRSVDEYQESHIEGDLHIPYQTIVAKIQQYSIAKDAEIKLYCRSGGRAGKARQSLLAAGYSDVKNAGGIDDVRKERSLPID